MNTSFLLKVLFAACFLVGTSYTLSAQEPSTPYFENSACSYVEVDTASLFCRTMGKGDPLVIVHGGPGLSQEYLLPYLTKLAQTHFLIFYDQRGCGESLGEVDPNTINLETFVADLEALRQHFGFDTISILGHSWGGFTSRP